MHYSIAEPSIKIRTKLLLKRGNGLYKSRNLHMFVYIEHVVILYVTLHSCKKGNCCYKIIEHFSSINAIKVEWIIRCAKCFRLVYTCKFVIFPLHSIALLDKNKQWWCVYFALFMRIKSQNKILAEVVVNHYCYYYYSYYYYWSNVMGRTL